jgi:CubicO group peptidase (beta-lactamase class C family)
MTIGNLINALAGLAVVITGCTDKHATSKYDLLREYDGKYEYSNPRTLNLEVSDYDSVLYAIIDDAQYPLKFISKDTFESPQKSPVIFNRDQNNSITSYTSDGQTFRYLGPTSGKREWYPRKELHRSEDSYKYVVPQNRNDGIAVADLNHSFKSPELLFNMVRQTIAGEFRDVHSILIWKDGKLVLEEYFYGYDENKPHQLRSASKSFIGTLVGIAIDQGHVKSENELLIPFFASEYREIDNLDLRKKRLTIKDFLTYRHGMDCNDEDVNSAGHELKMYESSDWIKFTLDLPMTQEPGVTSSYCTGCAQTIGRLVEIATQTPLVEYADKNLFQPMQIVNYKWRFKPDTSSIATFNQMYLRPRDILKLAIMYHQGGKWQGKQIVSNNWIAKTFAKDDHEFGYLWRHKSFDVGGRRYHSYLATGNGGQKINIWPELDMITIFTGGNYNAWLYGRTTPPNEMIPAYILRALESPAAENP